MLTILADEDIPLLDILFSQLGAITAMPGREIRSQHLAGVDVLLVRSVTQIDSDLLRGSAVRFVGSCTIGTDHFDALFKKKKLSGADVYVSFQLFKFWQGGPFGNGGGKKGKGIRCYDF